jgi:hypothetical protein
MPFNPASFPDIFTQLPNVLYTPHCAWFSDDSSRELRMAAAKEIRRALVGRIPNDLQNCTNKEALLAKARGESSGINFSSRTGAIGGLLTQHTVKQQLNGVHGGSSAKNSNLAAPQGLGLPTVDMHPFAAFAAGGMPEGKL